MQHIRLLINQLKQFKDNAPKPEVRLLRLYFTLLEDQSEQEGKDPEMVDDGGEKEAVDTQGAQSLFALTTLAT